MYDKFIKEKFRNRKMLTDNFVLFSGPVFQFGASHWEVTQISILLFVKSSGPGSSVDIATDYGLDGPESNPGGDEIFHPSIPALVPTQPPVKWVRDLSRG